MFSKSLEQCLNDAFNQARQKRHEFITVEHLLLCLLDDPEAESVLAACGADLERLRTGLDIFIKETTPHMPIDSNRDIQPTLSFQRVLQRAIYQAQSTGRPEVTGANILTAIFGEEDSQAVYFLHQERVTRIDVMNYVTHGISKPPQRIQESGGSYETGSGLSEGLETRVDKDPQSDENLIEQYTINLNHKAMLGRIDPLIGRK